MNAAIDLLSLLTTITQLLHFVTQFSYLGYCKDSNSEELQTLEERRKQILAGKLVTPAEGALESTGAKNDLVVPAATASSLKVIATEGVTATAGGPAPQATLVVAEPSSIVPPADHVSSSSSLLEIVVGLPP